MKLHALLCASLLLTTLAAQGGTVTETPGTPSNSYTSPPTLTPTPNLESLLINFDTPALENPSATCVAAPCSSLTLQGVTFSSPDGVQVIPYSTQSAPDELYDASLIGAANLTISLTGGVTAIGVGIADGDLTSGSSPVTITLEALGLGGANLGTFNVTLPPGGSNPANGYFVVNDTTPSLYGLNITTAGGSNDSGLAVDDVQVVVPEPSSYVLLTSGAALLFCLRKLKRA
jgi:hypothetical protein